jgi:GT2 family glycosyltransferase
LVAFLNDRPDVGVVGSRLEDPDGTPQRSAFRFPSVLGELESGLRLGLATRLLSRWVVAPPTPTHPCQTDWVSGACLMVRREVFDVVGLLDETYFLYFEEVDFCRRAHRAGWSCWYNPQARVAHLVGRSSGLNDLGTRRGHLPNYWFDSRRRYFLTHLGPLKTALANLAWSLGFLSFRCRQVIQRKPDTDPAWLWLDFVRYNFFGSGS